MKTFSIATLSKVYNRDCRDRDQKNQSRSTLTTQSWRP